MDEVIFGPGSVPVAVAARVFGKDACWVRAGIITGYLNIGTATRNTSEIVNGGQGVNIRAKMPNTTNVTNNTACAVTASIKITFS